MKEDLDSPLTRKFRSQFEHEADCAMGKGMPCDCKVGLRLGEGQGMRSYAEDQALLRKVKESSYFECIDDGASEKITVLDPPGCGCTDCLTGYSEPMSQAEYDLMGFPGIRVYKVEQRSTKYYKDTRL